MKSRKPHDPRYDLDDSRKVFIYKNLHKDCWSIKQDGLVKAHVTEISLYSCSFRVNRLGRRRVLREKRKNVHAGASGWIDSRETFDWNDNHPKAQEVTYNPYTYESSVYKQGESPCL